MTIYTIYTKEGKRATTASFLSRNRAEQMIKTWILREKKGIRPDVTTEGLYVDEVRK